MDKKLLVNKQLKFLGGKGSAEDKGDGIRERYGGEVFVDLSIY